MLQVILKSVYGKPMLYPANEAALALADIAGTKTLDPKVLRIARDRLGMKVVTLEQDKAQVVALLGIKEVA